MAGGATFWDRAEDRAGDWIDNGEALLALLRNEEARLLGAGFNSDEGQKQKRYGKSN